MYLFTDDEKILSKLSEKGNPLEHLYAFMDWNIFLPVMDMKRFSNIVSFS